ncbi:2,3-bisphosphoglycerate-dependent phosphoglycerate mutase [Candidatus Pelagibacter sp.]|uniref:2,3-bisphosphoglycerate-dependent phosphoglycerate mutase n=1 Tax=Candidatus Pelagibacter sp. TaxID=2024849 RepID=UPI003F859069
MSNLILVRHGQSIWNLENRFTGWVDVDITDKGEEEAKKAGDLLLINKLKIDYYFTSFQLRAKRTLSIIKKILNDDKQVQEFWELNERHYGALTGLNKDEMKAKLGEQKVHEFRRSWNLRPDKLDKDSPYHPLNSNIYKDVPKNFIPDTESLEDTYDRVIKIYNSHIKELVKKNNILISAHGNSIRALCKFLFKLDENQISRLEIPTGNPLYIKFDNNENISECRYLDNNRAKDLVVF